MNVERVLSLAAGTVPELAPDRCAAAAAEAGFDATGIWFDPETWTSATSGAVREVIADLGIDALDVEPVIVGRTTHDEARRLLDAAVGIGARHVLVASGAAPRSDVVEVIGDLAQQATGTGVGVVLEFLPIFSIASLSDAQDVVDEVGRDDVGILVDTLHLDRCGASAADLAGVGPNRLPYLQLADATAERPTDLRDLTTEALDGRLLPGDGDLPLGDVLDRIPDVPISVELRSRALRDSYPDPFERASVVAEATRRFLDSRPLRV